MIRIFVNQKLTVNTERFPDSLWPFITIAEGGPRHGGEAAFPLFLCFVRTDVDEFKVASCLL